MLFRKFIGHIRSTIRYKLLLLVLFPIVIVMPVSLALAVATDCEPICLAGPAAGAGVGVILGRRRSSLQWTPLEPTRLRRHHIAWRAPIRIGRLSF